MRLATPLTTTALLLAVAATAVACDDGGSEKSDKAAATAGSPGGVPDPGADGDGTTAISGLGKADTIDELVKLVNTGTLCESVSQRTEDTYFSIDADVEESAEADAIAATDKAFSIKARASCWGESHADNNHDLFLVDDMKKFQTAYKDHQRSDGDPSTRYFVGQNFVVKLNAKDGEKEKLVRVGTLGLNCSANFVPPAGYRNEQMIDGCVLTDYVD